MGAGRALIGFGVLAAVLAVDAEPAGAFCSVFTRHPCFPTACSLFASRYCTPYSDYWIGQDLRLTIESASARNTPASGALSEDASREHKLDTLHAMFDALRACWIPPAKKEAYPGMQMSVRFAFKRSGDIIATPRVTYASQGVSRETREVYLHAISAALERCTPLHLSQGLATQSQAGLLRSVLSIIVSSRDEKVACCWLDVGFIGASERGGRANPASQHVERGDGGAARMLGSAAPRSVAHGHADHRADELPPQRRTPRPAENHIRIARRFG